jgi:hypothetical protein
MGEITVKPGPQDLLRGMSTEVYRAAYGRGMSLSAYLEQQDPSEQYHDGLDAFARLLKCADIRTQSLPELGVYASKYEDFDKNDQTRALVPEFIARCWRRAQTGRDVLTRSLYSSGDAVAGGSMRPYAEAAAARVPGLAPAIPLSELVAITTPIDSDSYRAWYLTDTTAQERQVRVGPGAEIPTAKLTGGDHTITLHKFGRGLEATYEQLRRQRLDMIALHIGRLSIQTEADKVAAALAVLVAGDGNASTGATVSNLTTLDTAATAGTLSLKGWLAFKMLFTNPYSLVAALAPSAIALQLMTLNVGSANTPLVTIAAAAGFGGFSPINPGLADNVRIGWTSDAPANEIVGIDTRLALELVTEIGANISEIERYVSRQTQALYMTETEGFAVFDQAATKILNVAA